MGKVSKTSKSLIIIGIIVSVIAITGFQTLTNEELISKFQPVFEIMNYIESDYYDFDGVDFDQIVDETLKGTMRGLDDPFAWYFNAVQTDENQIDTASQYGGIGAVVQYNIEFDLLEVVAPMVDSPAEKVGLKTGDLIFEIDGNLVSETGYYESVNLLRGEPETDVSVKLYREGSEEPMTFVITREKIELKTVKYSSTDYEGHKIGYVRLTQFAEPTYREFQNALLNLLDSEAYIIDLRNNGGGLLGSALNISSLLVPKDETVITIQYRDKTTDVFRSWGSAFSEYIKDKPLVILVNGGSASASEILTGALKDHDLATIVGTQTFGKAAVQTVYKLSNGGEIWLPTAHYLTPNGSDIHLKGIEPDITVEATETINGDPSSEQTVSSADVDPKTDIQLKTGLDVLIERLSEGK